MDQVTGSCSLHRIGYVRFPNYALRDEANRDLVLLGRDGFLRIYFGRGRKVGLPDGRQWRIRVTGAGRHIIPVVANQRGVMVTGAIVSKRAYGINGPDFAYTFVFVPPSDRGGSYWGLWDLDREIAKFGPRSLVANTPIPLAGALLCFTLRKYGIPGASNLLPAPSHW